jgi:hypothetical protein
MKQKAHCPNCGANLELTVDVSIQGELKPEFRWLAQGEESEGSSESKIVGRTNVNKGEQSPMEKNPQSQEDGTSPGVLTEYVDEVIYHILSKAGSDGLSKDELWNLVQHKGVNEVRFEEALGIMSVRAEIYSLKDQKYRITY